MQPVEASPKPCIVCHGAGWFWMTWGVVGGVEPPVPRRTGCTQCCAPIVTVEAAAPVAPSEPTTRFNDPQVQIVYDLLNSDDAPPSDQHWEGWVARRIIDALVAAKPEPNDALPLNEYWTIKRIDKNRIYIEAYGMASATVSVMSFNGIEMLLAHMAEELLGDRTQAGRVA